MYLSKRKILGFTLIELLIAVSIIGILSSIGVVSYQKLKRDTGDAKKKADIDTIAKTYEEQAYDPRTGVYRPLRSNDFTGGNIPKTPAGGDYSGLVTDVVSSDFKVCAALEGNPTPSCDTPSATCYCKSSTQGSLITFKGQGLYTPTPTPTPTPTFTPTPTPTTPPPPPDSGGGGPTPAPICHDTVCSCGCNVNGSLSWQVCGQCSGEEFSCGSHYLPGCGP